MYYVLHAPLQPTAMNGAVVLVQLRTQAQGRGGPTVRGPAFAWSPQTDRMCVETNSGVETRRDCYNIPDLHWPHSRHELSF